MVCIDTSSVTATFGFAEVGMPPSPTGEGYDTAFAVVEKVSGLAGGHDWKGTAGRDLQGQSKFM